MKYLPVEPRVLLTITLLMVHHAWAAPAHIWRGVDLSYVNELEDCGARYRSGGRLMDPYQILSGAGANLVRLRLWHDPDWTDYSTLADVKQSIRRARNSGMQVLLDFHYSDDWAHPGKQLVPRAWSNATSTVELAERLGQYTTEVLTDLLGEGLIPDYVQVGNETNTDLLLTEEVAEDAPVDWQRNAVLLNAGIRAVREFSAKAGVGPGIMLHIAQPENVQPWFDDATNAGVVDFDLIGISYYPKWSSTDFSRISSAVRNIRSRYGKDVVIVETAYPWTLDGADAANNILGQDSLVEGFPASPQGQADFMTALMDSVIRGGGLGVVYWEPAWISTSCTTRWGQGSHWDNAALFNFPDAELLPGAGFLGHNWEHPDQPAPGKAAGNPGD